MCKPDIDVGIFPNFLKMWFSRDASFERQRKFVLKFAKLCMGSNVSGHHFKAFGRVDFFRQMMVHFDSESFDEEDRENIDVLTILLSVSDSRVSVVRAPCAHHTLATRVPLESLNSWPNLK